MRYLQFFICFIVVCLPLVCDMTVLADPGNANQCAKWFKPKDSPKGVAVVVHGLNNKPEIMDEVSSLLSSFGFAALRLTLDGHNGDSEQQEQVTSEAWLNNLRTGVNIARQAYPSSPLVFVGYSLGAPLALTLEDESNAKIFDALVFLAPALGLNCRSCFLRMLLPLKYLGVSLPSLAPEEYRTQSSTTLSAYSATFDLVDRAHELKHRELFEHTPGLIVVNSQDELVSVPQTRRWMERNGLQDWKLSEFESVSEYPKHLFVDQKSFGAEPWEHFSQILNDFLNELKK